MGEIAWNRISKQNLLMRIILQLSMDCVLIVDEECHRYDCYVNSVKIIQDTLYKMYEEEYEIGGK